MHTKKVCMREREREREGGRGREGEGGRGGGMRGWMDGAGIDLRQLEDVLPAIDSDEGFTLIIRVNPN